MLGLIPRPLDRVDTGHSIPTTYNSQISTPTPRRRTVSSTIGCTTSNCDFEQPSLPILGTLPSNRGNSLPFPSSSYLNGHSTTSDKRPNYKHRKYCYRWRRRRKTRQGQRGCAEGRWQRRRGPPEACLVPSHIVIGQRQRGRLGSWRHSESQQAKEGGRCNLQPCLSPCLLRIIWSIP
jgi:hypothetical protein